MYLVNSFVVLLQGLSVVMTAPAFDNFVTILTGWVFARRHTVTGMILAAVNLLDRIPNPGDDEIREGLAGNLCRCTGYASIVEAVRSASMKQGRS